MNKYVYTIYNGQVERHDIVRETKTGWTVGDNWNNRVTTVFIKCKKAPVHCDGSIGSVSLNTKYTSTSIDETVKIARRFQSLFEVLIHDSEFGISANVNALRSGDQ